MQKDAVGSLPQGGEHTDRLPGLVADHNLSVFMGSTLERTNGRKR